MVRSKTEVYEEFQTSVNMTKIELEKWLKSEESKSVGIKKGTDSEKKINSSGPESTGHESGRMIVKILDRKKADLSEDDYAHMSRVNAYIKRHIAQKPSKEDVETSRWRYSLMNWGCDPLKKR
jgi:DNA replication initiation complex subunit (GINS family)